MAASNSTHTQPFRSANSKSHQSDSGQRKGEPAQPCLDAQPWPHCSVQAHHGGHRGQIDGQVADGQQTVGVPALRGRVVGKALGWVRVRGGTHGHAKSISLHLILTLAG